MTHPENTTPANPAQVTDAAEALKPFTAFAEEAIERSDALWVWKSNIFRDRVCDWFGPSDFGLLIHFSKALTAAIGAGGQTVAELRQIEEMLDAGQGDDDGPQIMPDFEPDMSTLAKVEACLFLLEKRRDVIEAFTHPAPSGQAVAEGLHLTEYEIQVLLGTSIHGCNMSPDRVFSLDMAWHRLHAIDLIDRTDGLAIVTEKGKHVIATILSAIAHPVQPEWRPIETAPHNQTVILGWFDWRDGQWCREIGPASWGTRVGAASNMSGHGSAKYWLPLDVIPAAPQPKGE